MYKIKKLIARVFRRKQDMDFIDFSKIYGAYAGIVRASWEQMMKQLEEKGREEERQRILSELEAVRIYGGSVIPKMAEQVLKYKQVRNLETSENNMNEGDKNGME